MRTTQVIDAHTHYLPPSLINALRDRREIPRLITRGTREFVEYGPGPGSAYPLDPDVTDIDLKIQLMDEWGIDLSILSVNIPGVDWAEPGEAPDLARAVNSELMAVVKRHPGRFAALSVLPLQMPETAAQMLSENVAAGMKGAMIYSNVAGGHLDHPALHPFFAAAADLDVPVLIHPAYPLSASTFAVHAMIPVVAFLFDTTTAALRLIFDGLYERHPNFKLILSHAGSVIPYIVGRIDYASALFPNGAGELTVAPSVAIKNMYVDTVCAWPLGLQLAIDYLGPQHILFGTDHPYWQPNAGFEALDAVSPSPELRTAILRSNSDRIFKLDGPS
ncbi:MAG TPA: amidohydrolase family protein [Candidatus Acidoferrum sp.]|jgi:aminocarboxymuconate-semialdehyde decarboxylase|nr:amidohydrolase family protein [Candidatus Acidoferrum sp.]